MQLTTKKIIALKSNEGDTNRTYTVSGEIHKSVADVFEKVNKGSVAALDGAPVAYFNGGSTDPLAINFTKPNTTIEEQSAVLTLIMDFITAAKAEDNGTES